MCSTPRWVFLPCGIKCFVVVPFCFVIFVLLNRRKKKRKKKHRKKITHAPKTPKMRLFMIVYFIWFIYKYISFYIMVTMCKIQLF